MWLGAALLPRLYRSLVLMGRVAMHMYSAAWWLCGGTGQCEGREVSAGK